MDSGKLSIKESFELIHLMMDLRQSAPIGVVGTIETRNLLARLFPDFEAIRDQDVDSDFRKYAESLNKSLDDNLEQDSDD